MFGTVLTCNLLVRISFIGAILVCVRVKISSYFIIP